ncbi:flavin reductase family protein [Acinetobacter qingfengensis]|uniref:Flavoprotein oxidoreductase n=1 Tax=Acinetobacter qingfengensis TaxID=1262585 RepID=A0A1E7RCG1_9GAMM|nr:flavin reductase family protein [Acinetobacter qingfengensis]KAA8735061.1 flavin reductase family protein [Acinetobacter qingfengensis]OEY97021.1 flavoprotein oxidoreductase [Acinetobacter qingfengensis]
MSMEAQVLKKCSEIMENSSVVQSVEIATFKQSMRHIASPVAIVTTSLGDLRHGLTATAICSVSMEPPSMLVCVNRNASAEKMIAQSGVFAINMLTEEQHSIARLFSTPGVTPEQRYSEGEWHTLMTGAPVLQGAVAAFDCVVEQCISSGTHNLYIGRVLAAEYQDQNVLLYRDGLFRKLERMV